MSFLALTPLQAGLLLGATGLAVIGLYWLKPPPQRIVTPSNLIWIRLMRERKRSSLIDRLRWWISLLVALAIGLAVAAGLGRPQLESLGELRVRRAIVLDNSASMATRSADGFTRWQHAVERARRLIVEGGEASEYLIVDTAGQVSAPRFESRRGALDTLDELEVTLSDATAFPRLAVGDAELYFISDGVLVRDAPATAETVSVFRPADNVAITAFEIRSIPADSSGYQAYLEVVNTSLRAKEAALRVSGVGGNRLESTVTLAPGEPLRHTFDLAGFERGAVRATVSADGDAFEADNAAFSYLPIRSRTRVVLVTDGNIYLETILLLDPRVDLRVVRPQQYEPGLVGDVLVFDRWAPATAPAAPAILFGVADAAWGPVVVGELDQPDTGVGLRDHPLLEHVALDDLDVDRAWRIRLPEGSGQGAGLAGAAAFPSAYSIVLGTRQEPLIVAAENPVKRVWLTFVLDRSNFPLQPGFPIFLSNALTWAMDEQLALPRAPGRVEVPLPAAAIAKLDGTEVDSWPLLERTVFETDEPGLYTATRGERRLHVAVNLADRQLSDINRSAFPEEDRAPLFAAAAALTDPGRGGAEPWVYLLAGALLLLAVEWGTYHRRWTV